MRQIFMMRSPFDVDVIDVPENTAKRNGDQMRTEKWIIFGMLVALLAGCSGKKAAEISADAKVGSIEYKMLMNWFL